MNELRIPQWYLALASTLHLNIVFPIAMVLGSVVAGLTLTEAMSGFLAGTLAFTFLMLAYTLNKGYGRGNIITRTLFTLCVFLEVPEHNDNNSGLAYFFIFAITGIILLLIQLSLLAMRLIS